MATFQLSEVIRLYEPCNVLLCLLCQAGMKPGKSTISHFRNQHKLKGQELQQVVSFAASIPHVSDPATVELPQDGSIAVDELPKLKGYSCTSCRYLTINRDNVVAHQRTEAHTTSRGPGWTVVTLQSFGRQRHARYWVVQRGDGEKTRESQNDTGIRALDGLASSFQACEETLEKEAEERRKKVEEPGTSRWVAYMGWTKHLRQLNRAKLRMAGASPHTAAVERKEHDRSKIDENKRMRLLADSFERELRRSAQRIDQVPTQSLKWLASVDPTKPVGKPFDVKEKEETWKFYCSRFQRYLCYCVRVWALGRRKARQTHRARFTDKQWQELGGVVRRLDVVAGKHSTGQLAAASASEEQDPDEEMLDRAVFSFCIYSLEQKICRRVYDNPLLHFTSVLAIGPTKTLWMPAHSFTRSLAGILWCSRVLILENSFAPYDGVSEGNDSEDSEDGSDHNEDDEDSSDEDDDGDDGNDSDGTEAEVTGEAVENFARAHRDWLCDGVYSPISTVIEWMAYGRGFRRQELGTPRLAWEQDGKTLNFEGERIQVTDLQRAATAIVDEAETLLDALLAGAWAQFRSTIVLEDIIDSLIYEGPGRSFATNDKNRWLRPGSGRMAELVRSSLFRAVETESGRILYECRRQATEEFILRLKRFKSTLLAAVHIWGGQPGRGPEMTTLKHCDTEELPRNVFVFDGLVVLITDHDKQRKGRRVARWLPADVSRIMVAYVAWLVPLEQVLHRLSGIRGPADTLQPWLWKDASKGLWSTDDLSRRLDALTSTHVGVRLTVASYRHVAIELGRHIKGLVVRQMEMDATGGGNECEEWMDPQTGELRQQPLVDYVWDLQATHGSRIAASHYALSVLHPDQLQPEMLMNYKLISELWHGFLRSGSEGSTGQKRRIAGVSGQPVPKRGRTGVYGWRDDQGAQEIQGRSNTGITDIDAGLRTLYGPAAQWKSEQQREIMTKIVGLQDSGVRSELLIVVLPTGGGKSVFFMLPAVLDEGGSPQGGSTSIAVVPFAALLRDMEARAREMGVDCLWWRTGEHGERTERQRDARLVLVSADVAVSLEFMAYVQSIRSRGRLGRIFFDECHTSITDVSYRARLGTLKEMHRFGCPLVMLTATLPVTMEAWYREAMLCKDAVLVRSVAVKHNIRYQVRVVRRKEGTVQDAVVDEMRRLERAMTGSQKGIVYCRSIAACELLGEAAGCGVHHSNASEDANQAAFQAWTTGRDGTRWIVATSGLGTGIDIGGITAIVHMQEPYGLVDFVQQTGRGGRRAGEAVESVIVTDGRPVRENEFEDDISRANRAAMGDFIRQTGCRRIRLGKFLDGAGQECREMDAELCDNCQATKPGGSEAAGLTGLTGLTSRLQEKRRDSALGVTALQTWLDALAGPERCSVCFVKWHIHGKAEGQRRRYQHGRSACTYIRTGAVEEWRRRLRFNEYICCWSCGLPFGWCMEAREGSRCRYREYVMPVVMMVGVSGTLREKVEREFGIDVGDAVGYRAWLVRSRQLYEEEMTNALAFHSREQERGKQGRGRAWRHIAIAISNRYLNKAFGEDVGEEGEFDEDDEGTLDNVWDLQAAHSTHVAGMVYARELQQGATGTAARRDRFRAVSRAWHRFFGLGAEDRAGGPGAGRKRKTEMFDSMREEARFRRFARLQRADIPGQLKVMMGPEARFRGMQEEVIRAVVRGESPMVQVAGTGEGKSMSFMLAAFCSPDGVTVVVVPLVGLRDDLRERCERSGIDTHVWQAQGANRAAAIVFVTPESAVTKGFRAFVNRLQARGQLDRVFVDECHTVLDSDRGFRPQMGELGPALQEIGVQVVFLTATLAPADVGAFYARMMLDGRRVRLFRSRTTRRNIGYRVRAVSTREEEDGEVQRVVRAGLERYGGGKMIVYGGEVQRVERLGVALSCPVFHSKVDTGEGKSRRLREWVKEGQVIVTTNALGMGIDVADVRMVVHAGAPRRLRDYAQESGRAGRDGEASEAVIVWRKSSDEGREGGGRVKQRAKRSRVKKEGAERKAWVEEAMEEFMRGSRCRRVIMDRVMDGYEERAGCEEGEVACGVCECDEAEGEAAQVEAVEGEAAEGEEAEGEEAEGEAAKVEMETFLQARSKAVRETERVSARARREGEELARFIRQLESWAGCCAVCRWSGEVQGHEMGACPKRGSVEWMMVDEGIQIVTRELFEKRRMARFSGCFYCGLPQWLCERWVEDGDGGRFREVRARGCQYGEVLVRMYVGLRARYGDDATRVLEEMKVQDGQGGREGDYVWLGGLIKWAGIQASRICRVCVHLAALGEEG